ncbi:MAG: hypothetical protein ACKO4U_09660, partial [Caldilinea sp.]
MVRGTAGCTIPARAVWRREGARLWLAGALGYVGLPLAVAFAEAGYRVNGIDLDTRKVDAIS